jgi:hypothetical protein
MSTQAAVAGAETLVVAADTYISSNLTEPNVAVLPQVDDGAGVTVAVGTEIRFECTGGSPITILTADRRYVGLVPGYGAAVVVAEQGENESMDDFWRFQVLPASPAAHQAAPTAAQAWAVLVQAGLAKAE